MNLDMFGFAIGDCVRVRQFEDMAAQYGVDCDGDISIPNSGGNYFYHDMKHYCGLDFTISKFAEPLVFGHGFADKDGYEECITPHMLEKAEPEKPYDQTEINEFLKQFAK